MPTRHSATRKRVDTPRGVTPGGGGDTGPSPELRKRVVSGDRNTGGLADPRKQRRGERRRTRPAAKPPKKET